MATPVSTASTRIRPGTPASDRPLLVADSQMMVSPELTVEWLAELTGRTRLAVCELLLRECQRIGNNVQRAARDFGLESHVWSSRLLEFYASTDAFLFETASWNACRWKARMRSYLCTSLASRLPPGARVLCFGDGMGYDSAALSEAGLTPTCFEVSGPCLDFARRLFEIRGQTVRILSDEAALEDGEFSAIVCLDVLEHVPDPQALLRCFSRWLSADGLLVAHAPFYHVDGSRPTHLAANRRYAGSVAGFYGPCGFHAVETGGLLLDPVVLVKAETPDRRRVSRSAKTRLLIGQVQSYCAKLLPGVPGLVAGFVAKPDAAWTSRLKRLQRELQCGRS